MLKFWKWLGRVSFNGIKKLCKEIHDKAEHILIFLGFITYVTTMGIAISNSSWCLGLLSIFIFTIIVIYSYWRENIR